MADEEVVLVIGDTHAPCLHPRYIDHCLGVAEFWGATRAVHIGDLVDNHCLSFHLREPRLKSVDAEYRKALRQVRQIVDAFDMPVDLMLGNHDVLHARWAKEVGLDQSIHMRCFSEIWELPSNWTIHPRYSQLKIGSTLYQHGDRGRGNALLNAQTDFSSLVQGHHHQLSSVSFVQNASKRIYAVQTGCGVSHKHLSQSYGRKYAGRPVLSCAVAFGSTAVVEPMQ